MGNWQIVKNGAQRTLTGLLQATKFKFGLGIGDIEFDGQKMFDSYNGDGLQLREILFLPRQLQ
jgi:hypothetical protein